MNQYSMLAFSLAVSFFVSTVACCAADNALRLKFNSVTKATELKDDAGKTGEPKTTETTDTTTVILGKDYFSVSTGDVQQVYDFAKKRVSYDIKDKAKSGTYSLYAIPAFREMELQNRMVLRKVLSAVAKPDDKMSMGDDIVLESLFGMSVPSSETDQKKSAAVTTTDGPNGAKDFTYKGVKIASFTPGAPIDPQFKPMYDKWLLYYCTLAPRIRKVLQDDKRVPSTLMFRSDNPPMSSRSTTLTLAESQVTTDGAPTVAAGSLQTAVPAADPAKLPTKEAMLAGVAQKVKENNYLDAFLITVEYQLSVSPETEEAMELLRPGLSKDPGAVKLAGLMSPKCKEEAEAAVKAFADFDRKTLTRAYLLDILKANVLTALGEGSEAVKLFQGVLAEHPYVTGAYVDLGKLYFSAYETQQAWYCWDQARRLSPNHPMIKEVDQLQAALEKDHPEYF